ncbi:MAG TPA: protein phosphatase 2C domain-containing protein [Kofleriaceae bacterium]|nr:protein phosphatase 2C domain-containing protein [Kofleriaceae bacterium]
MATAAAVTGARHRRSARNGQDAAAAWSAGDAVAVVVCDGCGSGASSEVGARLGARVAIGVLAQRLAAGARADDPALWQGVRAGVLRALAAVLEQMPGDRAGAIAEHFLFTIVAAAATREGASVWAIGDGAYAIDHVTRTLGPFANNQPPYLAYEILGDPVRACFEPAARAASIVVATDGAAELPCGLAPFGAPRFVANPDAVRRALAVYARDAERIDWDARRVVRTPAALQDDGAIGVLLR